MDDSRYLFVQNKITYDRPQQSAAVKRTSSGVSFRVLAILFTSIIANRRKRNLKFLHSA